MDLGLLTVDGGITKSKNSKKIDVFVDDDDLDFNVTLKNNEQHPITLDGTAVEDYATVVIGYESLSVVELTLTDIIEYRPVYFIRYSGCGKRLFFYGRERDQ